MELKGRIKDKNAIIIDDIIDTGATIIRAADLLRENGAWDIYVAATHGLFSGEALNELEKSVINKITITNTLPLKASSDMIEVLK